MPALPAGPDEENPPPRGILRVRFSQVASQIDGAFAEIALAGLAPAEAAIEDASITLYIVCAPVAL